MSLSYCSTCEQIVEGATHYEDDGIGEVQCCDWCNEATTEIQEER